MNSKPIKIFKYDISYRKLWNEFVGSAKNSTFLFHRNYMDYHSDRYKDHSLVIIDYKNRVLCLFPANESNGEIVSHGGLTYGGLILNNKASTKLVIDILDKIIKYYSRYKFTKLIYKVIPSIYHKYPADEDLYALFRIKNSRLYRRDIGYGILMQERINLTKNRKRMLAKAKKNSLIISKSLDFDQFMKIEFENLDKKYGIKPVHTTEEIKFLADNFPDNIKLYVTSSKDNEILCGTIIYESEQVVHTQYIGNTPYGQEIGAFDILMDHLLNEEFEKKTYFYFGISTEKNGTYLNEGLAKYKESFGARGIIHDFYEIDL